MMDTDAHSDRDLNERPRQASWDERPLSTIESPRSPATGGETPVQPPEQSNHTATAGVALAMVVALALGYFFFSRDEPTDGGREDIALEATPHPSLHSSNAQPDVHTLDALGPPVELPTLGLSDAFVRTLLGGRLEQLPGSWAFQTQLVRKFVGAVDNVANGVNPIQHVRFLKPADVFSPDRRTGAPLMGTSSYARFDPTMAVLQAVPEDVAIGLYHRLEPLFEQAYRELGYGEQTTFAQTVRRAIDQVVELPVLDGPIRLIPRFSSYRHADPRLESLNDAQKLFLRLGPDHLAALQRKLRAFRDRL